MNLRSLRFRVAAWYAGLLAAALLIFGASVYVGLEHYLYSSLENTLASQCRTIGNELLSQLPHKSQDWLATEINEAYAPEINDGFIRVIRDDHTVLYVSGAPKDNAFDPLAISIPDANARNRARTVELAPENNLLIRSITFDTQGGHFEVESGAPYNSVKVVLHGLLLTFVGYMPLIITLAVGGGYWLMRRSLKPVDEITQRAEGITSTNLSGRLPVIKTGDELERLSVALNRMIARLDEAFSHINRFSADASHELRTPLTILQLELEGILHNYSLSPPLSDQIASALEETCRLSRIVENLLAISRLDAGEIKLEKQRVDLSELASSTIDAMKLLAEEKAISLLCFVEPEVFVDGDRSRLQQVIVNLVDNAVKYTPEYGQIQVRVEKDSDLAVIEVADNGVGISAEALPHLFERFYRADKARSRASGGAGLGLAIVKAICAAHGAEIKIETQEGSGSRFRVELPLAVHKDNFGSNLAVRNLV